jgi:hypothetical protein
MPKCLFKIVRPGESVIEKHLDIASVNEAWDHVFEHVNSLPPQAVLEVKSDKGERVVSVGAGAAKLIRDTRSARARYSTECQIIPIGASA